MGPRPPPLQKQCLFTVMIPTPPWLSFRSSMSWTVDFYQVHPTVMLFLPSVFNRRALPVVINIRSLQINNLQPCGLL